MPNKRIPFTYKRCPICGTEFAINFPGQWSRFAKPAHHTYCSRECSNKSRYNTGNLCQAISPTEAAYIAGFFDGEGTVSIYKRGSSYATKIAITNTHLPVIQYIATVVGGGSYKLKKARSSRHKQGYTWIVNADFARTLLEQLLPYLIVKQEQAKLAIEFQLRLHDAQSRIDKAWQHEYYLRNRTLNMNGPP
jgi:hypothetical protein